ncbi:MAG: hypothetical protein ACKVOU_13225 [Cytophagales bacterium]
MMNSNPEIVQKRKNLESQSKAYEQKITEEVDLLKDKAVDVGKYALVAGSMAVVGFILAKFVYNVVVGDEKDEEKNSPNNHLPIEQPASLVPMYKEPKEQPLIVKMIMSAIATFLLSIAKQKLTQFIEQLYAKEADKDSKPTA